jgi:hypothetical protein
MIDKIMFNKEWMLIHDKTRSDNLLYFMILVDSLMQTKCKAKKLIKLKVKINIILNRIFVLKTDLIDSS